MPVLVIYRKKEEAVEKTMDTDKDSKGQNPFVERE